VLRNRAKTAVNMVYEDSAGSLYSLKPATGDLGDPKELLTRLRAHPPVAERSAVLTITTRWNALAETDAGPHGGVAACGERPAVGLPGALGGASSSRWSRQSR
jgi:hypothetical protein